MKTPPPQPLQFYTLQQLAERWRLHSVTIHRWLRSGKLKAVRFGRDWRISVAEVERVERESAIEA
jgi:excisionase family DNA binding protein